ncbi:MAG TPA: D-alanyl-D-alanine carboxypeptidase, partial [Candidatus Baltobacteraceae bacterium]|nr:D-alanyl-D-alanine carboxypeptidase [Candidatus Baltobacteraceae bacterium]
MKPFRCASLLAVGMLLAGAGSVVAARSSTASADAPPDLRAIFDKPAYKNATWGLRVEDGSRVLIDVNPQRQFFIGSVRKIFSVGQLLNAVGAGHTYDTPVYREGPVDNGVLHGNLILVASGDLTMGGRSNPDGTVAVSDWDHNEADSLGNAVLTKPNPLAGYQRLARAVKAAGIDRVDGEVIVDDRLFEPFGFRGEFNVRPIFVNDDAVDVSIAPGSRAGTRARVAWRPKSAALAVQNRLLTGRANSPNTLALEPILPVCIGSPHCTSTVQGSLPIDFVAPLIGGHSVVRTVRIVQPSNYARTVFVEALKAAGVAVAAPVVEQNPIRLLPAKGSYRSDTRVAKLTGLTVAQDAKLVLKISYNIGADTSLVLFGLTHKVDTMPGALQIEQKNLEARYGIASSEYHFVDGSGGGDTTATNAAVTK